jgi:hypothetical protein
MTLSFWIHRDTGNDGDRLFPICTDALEIPAFEVSLLLVSSLEKRWMPHPISPSRLLFSV